MTLGERISYLRKLRGLSQVEFARRVELHNNYLSRIENDRFRPAADTLVRIAVELGVTPEELAEDVKVRDAMTDPLLHRAFREAQSLDDQDKKVLIHIVNAFLTRKKVEQALTAE